MKNNITELIFILDKSGSMEGLQADTVGGFNAMIKKQKQLEGTVYVTTVLFANSSTVVHDRLSIEKIAPMTESDYQPGGCTALMDALGDTIRHIAGIHRYARPEDVPERTIFVITTDGYENASRRYSAERVRSMIKHEEEKYGWEFLFLAANIDAVETAEHYGINAERAVNYKASSTGTVDMYACVSEAITGIRSGGGLKKGWGKSLEEK